MRKALFAATAALTALVGFPGAAGAATGAQQFTLVFVGTFTPGASNTGTAAATGVINAVGQGVNSGFLVQPDGTFQGSNRLDFPQGSLNISFAGHLTGFSFDPVTCITRITGTGTWMITSGTGAFVGTTGSGTFTNNVTLVGSQGEGNCSGATTEISVIRLTGGVTTAQSGAAA